MPSKPKDTAQPVEEPQEAPSALLEAAPAEEDGSIVITAEEDGSVLLTDPMDDPTSPESHGFTEQNVAEAEEQHRGALDDILAEDGPSGVSGAASYVPDPQPRDAEGNLIPTPDSQPESALQEAYDAVGEPDLLPGDPEVLATPPFDQGEAPPQPEPTFDQPVTLRDTIEDSGAMPGVSPSPLQGPGEQPTQVTSGTVTDTTGDLTPPGMTTHLSGPDPDDPAFYALQVSNLRDFLDQMFPGETDRTNLQQPESTVDVAIRLLRGLASKSPTAARCPEQYCNQPVGHSTPHGVVHY